jgi:hypothetical protein
MSFAIEFVDKFVKFRLVDDRDSIIIEFNDESSVLLHLRRTFDFDAYAQEGSCDGDA